MKPIIINTLDFFNEIFEINLNKQPNQEFTTTINQNVYKIVVQTFINEKTQISFFKNGVFLGGGFVKAEVNYIFFSKDDDGAFFFLKNVVTEQIDFNYNNFDSELKLYYATLDESESVKIEIENYYNLLENTQNLAVW